MPIFFAVAAAVQMPVVSGYPADVDCETYEDGSTVAMSECFKMQSEVWEKRLNLEYQAAIERAEFDEAKLRGSACLASVPGCQL